MMIANTAPMKNEKIGKTEPMIVDGSLVYDARDAIAKAAIDNGYDYVLYVDSDMVFSADDLNRLLSHDTDICSGLYVTRRGENKNVCYSKIITRRRFPYRLFVDRDVNIGHIGEVVYTLQ